MAKAFTYWLLAMRPKTLTISIVPVGLGCALAWSETGEIDVLLMLATLAAAMLIQIGTNLHNDVADFERGTDDPATRFGPSRATAEGWLSAAQVRSAAYLSFAVALLVGVYLIWQGGWPILLAGLASLAAALAYTGGPRPLAYIGLGELFVWFFFGVVAVGGSYYLQVGAVGSTALLAGTIIGLPAAAVLVVNNYRDLDSDRSAGKSTLAVRYGRAFSCGEYGALMLVPFLLLAGWQITAQAHGWLLLPWLTLPWALWLVHRFRRLPAGPAFNGLLAVTALFQFTLGLLLVLALVLTARMVHTGG
jgi:1,4-dihydroxy-2-naphthoate octaprenyltransferase